MLIKQIDRENGILKVSHKEIKNDPYKNIRASFIERRRIYNSNLFKIDMY